MQQTSGQHGFGTPGEDYERSEFGLRVIVFSAAAIAGLALAALFIVQWARSTMKANLSPGRSVAVESPPPAPRHVPRPPGARSELTMMLEQEDRLLNSYEWIDADAGVVRIPVDRAMELIVAEGLPAATTQPATRANESATPTESAGAMEGGSP